MKRLREEPVDEREKKDRAYRAKLPLKKDAGRIEIREAQACERELRNLLEEHPDHFRSLRAMVEGRNESVTKTHRRDLTKWLFLLPDGTPVPAIAAVMRAAVRDTPDGLALAFPIDLTKPGDAATMSRAETELDAVRQKGLAKLRRIIDRDEQDHGQGSSR